MKGVVLLLVLVLLSAPALAIAGSTTSSAKQVQSTVLQVFSDGSAEVNQTVSLSNMSSITLPLLASQVGNILAISGTGSAVSYEVSGGNISLSTFGVSRFTLVYDTDALTSKQGSVWDLNLNSPFNMTVILPYQSTILSLTRAPASFSITNGKPELRLAAGVWQISYGLPFYVASTTSYTTTSTSASSSSSAGANGNALPGFSQVMEIGIVVGGIVISGAAIAVWRSRSKYGSLELRNDDREILGFIQGRGGSVSEVEIRERFSMPRTSAWRQAKRLEKLGLVRITKVGKQNRIELVKSPPESGI